MVEAVFSRAFPDDSARDILVINMRKVVIAERLGLYPEPTNKVRQGFLRDLTAFRFDKSMMRILSRERTVPELQLFLAIAGATRSEDIRRAEDVPLAGNPALDGTLYNRTFGRANWMLDEDLQAIDHAVEAVTGKPPQRHPPGGRRR